MKRILLSIIALLAMTTGAQAQSANGHDYVDLGLPSGLLWATCNVGATTPEGYGDYFAWGETTTKSVYSWDTYKWGKEDALTKYNATDGKTVLDAEDDAARANWGGSWRMPTLGEIEELFDNTTDVWTKQNGVDGCKFTSETNGNSIFIPSAGRRDGTELVGEDMGGTCWLSSLNSELISSSALFFGFDGSDVVYPRRYSGCSIRPVIRKEDVTSVAAVCTDGATDHALRYNLSGQRVGSDYKGVVIENGRKVVVK